MITMMMMRWSKGFHLGRKLVKLWRCFKRGRPFSYYHRLHNFQRPQEEEEDDDDENDYHCRTCSSRRRSLIYGKKRRGSSSSREVAVARARGVPKGHLAVYVGVKDPDHRFLVPILYINHPFFRRLLNVTEEEYGFHQAGGITIPCGLSDFESVKRSIAEEDAHHHRRKKETIIHRLLHHPF